MSLPLSHERIFAMRFPSPGQSIVSPSDAMIEGRFERRLKRRDESNLNACIAETGD